VLVLDALTVTSYSECAIVSDYVLAAVLRIMSPPAALNDASSSYVWS